MTDVRTDCRSEVGVTVGLVDALISVCRVLAARDTSSPEVAEALKDLGSDEDVAKVLAAARRATRTPPTAARSEPDPGS